MTIPVVGFFNNKGGVGKTSLVYHLAWTYADLELIILAADLDPQANLTAALLDEERLEQLLFGASPNHDTIYKIIKPLITGLGDIAQPTLEPIDDAHLLWLLTGDLALSNYESELSEAWTKTLDGNERAFRVMSAFWRVIQAAATQTEAKLVLMDLGPNIGAINRAALIACDYLIIPLVPDLFSLHGLRNLGPVLRDWRSNWAKRLELAPETLDIDLPAGQMTPLGYLVLQHSLRLDRPAQAYNQWITRIPNDYHKYILEQSAFTLPDDGDDPQRLALVRNYRSLMPMAQKARKPIFHLLPADGALGSHLTAARDVWRDFRDLALKIASKIGVSIPPRT